MMNQSNDDFPVTLKDFTASVPPDFYNEPAFLQVTAYGGVVIARLDTATIKTLFQRALNTWADAPPELFTFSDSLDKL